jgi:hypothetical protein
MEHAIEMMEEFRSLLYQVIFINSVIATVTVTVKDFDPFFIRSFSSTTGDSVMTIEKNVFRSLLQQVV